MLAFGIYHLENAVFPDTLSLLLVGASVGFTFSLYAHWRYSMEFVNSFVAEEVADTLTASGKQS